MADSNTLPLYEKVAIKRTVHRVLDVIIFSLLLSLLTYRLFFLHTHGFSLLQAIAFLCESWFTFLWVLVLATRWSFFDYKTYPDRLLKRVEELPPVDIFVTTADPVLEPPIITINTVLSLLAVDYPANKLACYVSDDGGSPVTFYSLSEALNFAKIWVPFCNKYKIQVRAPFRYFYNTNDDYLLSGGSPEFRRDWIQIKDEYEKLSQRIENAALRDLTRDLPDFSNIRSNDHPSIIKVIWENKEASFDGLPHLVYVSREKRPKHQHHYKAGAMNVLARVSGLMTNAPYILNVDCDMFVNNPKTILHAMCLLQDPTIDKEHAFVQFPQSFYNGLKDDPYGNQFHVLMEFIFRGSTGLQGPPYLGTGCVHRRKVLYGQSPNSTNIFESNNLDDELNKTFGRSENLKNSALDALSGKNITHYYPNLSHSNNTEALKEVASCDYEYHSYWGAKVGWLYGSATEDLLTGMAMHKKGWKSALLLPNPQCFLGYAPSGGPSSLTQQKRWVTGQLEVLFSTKSPIFTFIFDNLQLRQSMFYLWILLWGIRSIPELLYTFLPAYSLITNSRFLPNVKEPVACIPLLLFVVYNFQQLLQYLEVGQSIRTWWNNQKMGRVNTTCAYLFGVVGIVLKLLGLSETMFEVTKKGSSSPNDDGEMEEDSGRFTFDESPLFVPATAVLMIQLTAVLIGSLRIMKLASHVEELGVGEMICSVWLILCFWPFLKGMFAKGRFGIPWVTLFKSSALALLFVFFCVKEQ